MTPPEAAARPMVGLVRVFGERTVGLVRALRERFEELLRELGKFGVVGAVCYVIDVAVFNVVRAMTGEPILAKVVSTVIAATLAFLGNRFWTWRDRERSGLPREYALYFGVNLVGLLIGVACLWISHNWLGSYWPALTSAVADNISGNIIGVGLASLFRFWAYRKFVFRPEPAAQP